MTATDAIAPATDDLDAERRRKLALLRAVGLDRVSEAERELTLAIAKRYDLDLLLRHVVLIDGKPYVTRDALLWIAHRSGQFNGIEVTEPIVKSIDGQGDYWHCEATVYRKDMSHPFRYGGRYPTKGGNQKYGPEMAVKVAECMALRRAFNVSAPTAEERWDVDVPHVEPTPPQSLAERAAERAQTIATPEPVAAEEVAELVSDARRAFGDDVADGDFTAEPVPDDVQAGLDLLPPEHRKSGL